MKRSRHVLLMLRPPDRPQTIYIALSLFFLIGGALGYVAGGLVTHAQHRELSDYVLEYSRSASVQMSGSWLAVLFAYFRSPLALLLLGLAAYGVWLVPIFMMGQGFFLAYSVRCFGGALGRGGILLAFAAFGIRCLFVLPCVFYLASRSWSDAARLRRGSALGDRFVPSSRTAYPLLLCGIVLLIGCTVEVSLVPRLFSLILANNF